METNLFNFDQNQLKTEYILRSHVSATHVSMVVLNKFKLESIVVGCKKRKKSIVMMHTMTA
jgi:hypothetical protein